MSAFTYTAKLGLKLLNTEVGAWMGDNTAETIVGAEELTDGDMAVLTGWTLLQGTGGGTIVSSAGEMLFTQGGTAEPMHASQGYSVTEGNTYMFDVTNLTGAFVNLKISVGNSIPIADTVYDGSYETKILIANKNISITFTATATETIYVVISDEQATALTSTWDDATSRRSIKGLLNSVSGGLMIFGSLIKAAIATNAGTMSYSNFSTSNYAHQPYNVDFDPGTGALHVKFWLIMAPNSTEETIYERDSVGTAQRITVSVSAAGFLEFICDDGTTTRTVTSLMVVDDNVKHHIVVSYDGAGELSIYIDKVLNAIFGGSPLLTLTNTSAIVRWGVNAQTLLPLTNGKILLGSTGLVASTLSEITSIYHSEEILFHPDKIYTQVGESYSLDIILSNRNPIKRTIKNVSKTFDGTIKSFKFRNDKFFDIVTLPVLDSSFDSIRRFLDSVDNAELFTIDLKGTVAVPYDIYNYKIESDSYNENLVGADHIRTSFRVVRQ